MSPTARRVFTTVSTPAKSPIHTTLPQTLPPHSAIVHNHEVHAMDYVVASLIKSGSSLTTEEAVSIMFEAHNNGQALVITCPLEQAELYRDRIRTFGLVATIEKA